MWPFKKSSKIIIEITDEQSLMKIKINKKVSPERLAEVLFLFNSGQLKEVSLASLDDAGEKHKCKDFTDFIKDIYKRIDDQVGRHVCEKMRLGYLLVNKRNPAIPPSQVLRENST